MKLLGYTNWIFSLIGLAIFHKQSIEKLLWIDQLDLNTFAENEGSIFNKRGRRISI